jgi:Regulator of chromosome condensation (RCC1) repeat
MTGLWQKCMAVPLSVAVFFCGCHGTSQDSDVDGGVDAGADTTLDAGDIVDAGTNSDAGSDAGTDLLEPMDSVKYVDLSAGNGFTCGVRNTGAVDCWGDFRVHQEGRNLLPPADIKLKSVSAGEYHVCGVSTDDDTAVCWGSNAYNQSTPPDGIFSTVSAGGRLSCGLRKEGTIECWGDNSNGETDLPNGKYTQISAGGYLCALGFNGSFECWPEEYYSPPEIFIGISQGRTPNCGVHSDGAISCWIPKSGEVYLTMDGTFDLVAAGTGHVCALRADSTVECVGEGNFMEDDTSPKEQLAEPPFSDGLFDWISVGSTHSCGIRPDGQVACYGGDSLGQSTFTEGIQFRKVTAGGGEYQEWAEDLLPTTLGCGLDVDGRAHCWSAPFVEHTSVIANYDGKFTDLCASMGDVCGLTEEGSILCSGLAYDGFEVSGEYASISCAGSRWPSYASFPDTELCALDKEGLMTCWMNGALIEDRTTGPFTQVSVAGYGGCGIQPDGHLECFLFSTDVPPYPDGEFIQVEVGATHSCGVRKDGTVECFWSDNAGGQATPLPGEFTHVTTGMHHTCGLRKDRTIDCWPEIIIFPKGEFISLDAGQGNTCAISPNGALKCWGAILRGLSQADF